jgi:hypothetical protein
MLNLEGSRTISSETIRQMFCPREELLLWGIMVRYSG